MTENKDGVFPRAFGRNVGKVPTLFLKLVSENYFFLRPESNRNLCHDCTMYHLKPVPTSTPSLRQHNRGTHA